jgi:hypothetical protein
MKPILAQDSNRIVVIDNDKRFRKQLKRDIILLLLISMTCATGIVCTLYFSVKYDW